MDNEKTEIVETGSPMVTKSLEEPLTAAEIVQHTKLIQQIQEAVMIEGVHYGKVPGCKEPMLFKAGAEKLCLTFRLAPRSIIEDLCTEDEIRYRVKVELTAQATGRYIGDGIGECSSNEEKYKWREAVCDEEFEETMEDRRKEVWKKYWEKGKKITYQKKLVRTNPADIANTILKMAKKRGLTDATLTNTGASDIFKQDLEDLEEATREHLLAEEKESGNKKPEVRAPKQKNSKKEKPEEKTVTPPANPPQANGEVKLITEAQVELVELRCKQKGLVVSDLVEELKLKSLADIKRDKVNDVLEYIRSFAG